MAERISAVALRSMFLAGSKNLSDNKEWINDLNVFPVPDGDTGTNMTLTLMSAVKEVQKLPEDASLDSIGKCIATGTLRGARGNSGVIMSQLCRGFAKGLEGSDDIDADVLTKSMDNAVDAAYKAVMNPKEGTILTVARAAAEKAKQLFKRGLSLKEIITGVVSCSEDTLQQTPDMLPVLKEAGVVDSGGQGLVEFFHGARDAFFGKVDPQTQIIDQEHEESLGKSAPSVDYSGIETANIKFTYCTEFIIELEHPFTDKDESQFKEFLASIGDSIVCVNMDEIVKVHVHTNHPGEAIERALTYGELSSLKIDNMRIEHNEKLISSSIPERKQYGFVTVCSGEGLAGIFRELHADQVIEGGQTMNPSTEDILEAIAKISADYVFVLPNNGNIILAANQARDLCTDKDVIVIPTRDVCQGISAMIGFVPSDSPEQNFRQMTELASHTKSGEVTYAIRNTQIGGTQIRKGDYMGLGRGGLLSVSRDLDQAVLDMIEKLADEDTELITLYYGADTGLEKAQALASKVEEMIPDAEIEVVYGGQNVYNYLVSAE